jgi:hypothetical protein
MIQMLILRLLLVLLVGVVFLDLIERFDPSPEMLLIHSSAKSCDHIPQALLPRDHWDGARIVHSKDGGLA